MAAFGSRPALARAGGFLHALGDPLGTKERARGVAPQSNMNSSISTNSSIVPELAAPPVPPLPVETRPCSDCKQQKTNMEYFARQWKRPSTRRMCFMCSKRILREKRHQKELLRQRCAPAARRYLPTDHRLTAAAAGGGGGGGGGTLVDLSAALLLLDMVIPPTR
jgi:hypothetical protein